MIDTRPRHGSPFLRCRCAHRSSPLGVVPGAARRLRSAGGLQRRIQRQRRPSSTHPLHEIADRAGAAAAGGGARRRARAPAEAPRHAAAHAGRGPDADHPLGRRRRHHARRRRQPGARLRHRRRREPDSLPVEDRRSQGRGRDAVRAGGRPRLRRRPLRAGGVLDGVHGRCAVGHRIVRAGPASTSTSRSRPASDTDALRPQIEAILRPLQTRVLAPHVVGRGGLLRCAGADRSADRSRLQRDPASSIPKGHAAVEWDEKKVKQVAAANHVKLIIQPDDGLTPLLQAVRQRPEDDRHRHLPVRSRRAREGARGRGRARRRRPRAHRPHQPRRREEPAQARAAPARGGRNGRAHRRRSAALSRQDDDRRRQPCTSSASTTRSWTSRRAAASASSPATSGWSRRRTRCSRPTARASRTHRATNGWSSAPRARARSSPRSSEGRRSSC